MQLKGLRHASAHVQRFDFWSGIHFHRRKMSAHALLKITRDRFRVMSLAPRRKCPRNVVQMKVAMAAFFGSDSVANFLPL